MTFSNIMIGDDVSKQKDMKNFDLLEANFEQETCGVWWSPEDPQKRTKKPA